jgi:hypothetical protein
MNEHVLTYAQLDATANCLARAVGQLRAGKPSGTDSV